MHILIIPSFYPERYTPINGRFFRTQTKILVDGGNIVGTVYTEQKSLKKLFSTPRSSLYQIKKNNDEGILTYTIQGLSLLNQYEFGASIWVKLTSMLVDLYIKENGKPDIIHAHNIFHAGRVAKKSSEKHDVPFVITEHSSGFLLNEYSKRQLNCAKKIFSSSTLNLAVSGKLATAVSTLSRSQVQVVPNVIDTSFFCRKIPKLNSKKFIFISVGNLLINKGHRILIDAFHILKAHGLEAELQIYGEGPERTNLEDRISELGLENNVILGGKKTPEELVQCYNSAACLVLPSFKETFGVVIIEAMSCGLPVIATRSGGPEDIINRENGMLVDSGDVNELANAMLMMHQNYSFFDGGKITDFVNKQYSEKVVRNMLYKIYNEVDVIFRNK